MVEELLQQGPLYELAVRLFARHEVFPVQPDHKAMLCEMFGGSFPFREEIYLHEQNTGPSPAGGFARAGRPGGGNLSVTLNVHMLEQQSRSVDDDEIDQALALVNPQATEQQIKSARRLLARRLKVVEQARNLPASNYRTEALPSGVLAQLRYREAQQADRPNRNRHIYEFDSMNSAVIDANQKAMAGELYHLAGHPGMCEIPSARKISGVIRKVEFSEGSGRVPLELDIMEGEQGRAIFNLLRIAAAIPISSRAWGQFEVVYHYDGRFGEFGQPVESEEAAEDAETFMLITNFKFEGWDFVAGPQGVKNAIIYPSTRGGAIMRPQENLGTTTATKTHFFNNHNHHNHRRSLNRLGDSGDMEANMTVPNGDAHHHKDVQQKLIDRLEEDNRVLQQTIQTMEKEHRSLVESLQNDLSKARADAKVDSEIAERHRQTVVKLEERVEELRARHDEVREELAQVRIHAKDYQHQAESAGRLQEKIDELSQALKEREEQILTLEHKLTPPEPDEATRRMLAEKQRLQEEQQQIQAQNEKMRRELHEAQMEKEVAGLFAESRYKDFAPLLTPLVLDKSRGVVPESREAAAHSVKTCESFVQQLLEKARDLNFQQKGQAAGKGVPEGKQQSAGGSSEPPPIVPTSASASSSSNYMDHLGVGAKAAGQPPERRADPNKKKVGPMLNNMFGGGSGRRGRAR